MNHLIQTIQKKNIIFDTRVLSHKVYIGVENYTKILLDAFEKNKNIDTVSPSISNRYLSHLWLHCILPFRLKKSDILFSPANIAPLLLPSSTKLVLTLHDVSFLTFKDTFSKLFQLYYNFIIPKNIKKATTKVESNTPLAL
jgi:hypothetical protein